MIKGMEPLEVPLEEPQAIGAMVARFIKSTFDELVESVSSVFPSGTSVPDGWIFVKEDVYGVWVAKPEMLKAPFRGKPEWYRMAWALMTFDPTHWGDLYFNHLTPEDVVRDARTCPKIPDALLYYGYGPLPPDCPDMKGAAWDA